MRSITVPADVDALLHDPTADLSGWLKQQKTGPLKVIRAVQVAIAENDLKRIQDLLPELPEIAPAFGVRMMGLAALGMWEQVMEYQPRIAGAGLLDLEDAVQGHTAYGIAAAEMGDYDSAANADRMGAGFARAVGMANREQMLGLELERVLALAGRPAPEATQRKLLAPMPPLRRKWGQRNLAESHMALGCYNAALLALGLPDQDGTADAAMREWLHCILGLPPCRPDGHPLLDPSCVYLRLTHAGRLVAAKTKALDLDGITGDPQTAYAALLRATAMYKTPTMLQASADLFQSVKTIQPDQQFYKYIHLLKCYIAGATVNKPHCLIEQINSALEQMRPECDMVNIMARFAPGVMTMLLLVGQDIGVHPRILKLDLLRVPILAGKVIRYAGEERTIPGPLGTIEVLEAIGVPQKPLFSMQIHRAREVLDGLPRQVNLGWAAKGCMRMTGAARQSGSPSLSLAWRAAYKRIFFMLTEEVRKELLTLPEFVPINIS